MAGEIGEDDPDAPKCEVCGKPKHARELVYDGCNERENITANLCKEDALNIPDITKHFFFRGPVKSGTIDEYINRMPPEGHHLITVEAVEEKDWKKIFDAFGYNINCPQNGVMLPADMWVACHFGVPRHKGSHKSTFGDLVDGIEKTYVESVKDKLEEKREKIIEQCKENDIKGFHSGMRKISQSIFKKIIGFKWSIAADSFDYPKSGVATSALGALGIGTGCYKRCTSIGKKVNKKIQDGGLSIPSGSKSRERHKLARYITDQYVCNRDHSDDGCKSLSTMIEAKYRYNIDDPNIN